MTKDNAKEEKSMKIRRSRWPKKKQEFDYDSMAIPVAFINGLFIGSFALRKIRQYWEGGPMD